MEILVERKRMREKLLNGCTEWATSLPFKASAVLIGSYAGGGFNLWSDVDIVLMSDLTGTPLDRLKKPEFSTLLKKGIILRDDSNVRGLSRRLNETRLKVET